MSPYTIAAEFSVCAAARALRENRTAQPDYPTPFFEGTYFNRGCCSLDTAACPEGDETQQIVVTGEYE